MRAKIEEVSVEITQVKSRKINWRIIPTCIFYVMAFLLPVFALPLASIPFDASKALLFYFGISLAFLFWLVIRLQDGEVKIPKSSLFLSLGAIIAVWLASSLFSINKGLSFVGKGNEVGTFFFFLFLSIALVLISILFQSEKKAFIFYLSFFSSALIVFLFQFFHVLFGIDIIPLNVSQLKTFNLLGSWNDFAIFFGFIGLISLIFFELFKFKRYLRIILCVTALLSLLAMMAVNFFIGWIIFGFFVLALFVYSFSRSYFLFAEETLPKENTFKSPVWRLSFFVCLVVLFFILARGVLGNFTVLLKTSSVDVRPSWGTTVDIVKQSLDSDLLLGSGPNTFLYDWLKFKPRSINDTVFWNTRFISGVGRIPSMVATTGILGGLSLAIFLGILLFYGMKVLSYYQEDLLRTLLVASFFGSAYLWTFTIFYSPGFVIFALAFMNTGLLVAMLARAEKIKTIEFSFLKNPKMGFVSVLVIVFLILGSISFSYFFLQKGRSLYAYSNGVKILNTEGDIEKAEAELAKAIKLDSQDEYFRTLTEFNLIRLGQIVSSTSLSEDDMRSQFQDALASAIQNAQQAIQINSLDPANWMELGRVYESVVPLKIAGAEDMAIAAYSEALKVSPLDPTPLLASARVKVQSNKRQEARDYIDSALELKKDFSSALLLLSQIEVQEGNIEEAILRTEQTAFLAPNDIGVLFQLGLLQYQAENFDRSQSALERVISLNQDYANARYFLGLIYEKKGMTEKAIEQFEKIKETNPDNEEVSVILNNLNAGRSVLRDISPPAEAPEDRISLPIE